jgi:hypothetical protein
MTEQHADAPKTGSRNAPEDDGRRLADELEQQADELEHRSEELKQRGDEVREGWERKRADRNVPGAPPDND